MNNEELRRSVVAELERHSSGTPQSSDQLYSAIGSEKIGLAIDDFKTFLQHSNIPRVSEAEEENVMPRYHLPLVKRRASRNQKRSSSQSSRTGTPDSTLKRFNPRVDGFMTLFKCARRLQPNSNSGSIAWNEIRNLYRKDTNRHLNSEELNLICGTSNKTKHELLTENLRAVFETVDTKGLIVRLNAFSTPSPSILSDETDGPISPPMSPQSSTDPDEDRKIKEKRRKITESLIRSGLLKSDGARLTAADSGSVVSECLASQSSISSIDATEQPEDPFPPGDEVFEEIRVTNISKDGSQDAATVGLSTEKMVDLAAGDAASAHPAGQSPDEEASVKQEDAAELFERSVGEHRNSLGSIDEDACEASFNVPNPVDEDSDVFKAQVSSVSSQMNAAFIANDSQEISFASVGAQETSGEGGYVTGREHLSPLSDPDISLNISTSLAEPDTPRITNEFAMCSSRNANDSNTAMPQPDISPLTEEDEELERQEEEPVTVRHRRNEVSADTRPIEERVPHLSFTPSRDSQQKDEVFAASVKPEEAVNKDVVLPPINTAGGSTVATLITTVTATISPSKFNKKPASPWDNQDTDEEDIPYDDESQPDDHDHPPVDFEVTGSSSTESAAAHTIELKGKGQTAKADTSFVPPIKLEYLHVEQGPVRRNEEIPHDAKSLSTIPEDRETISSLSPTKELEQRPMDIETLPPSPEAAGDAPPPKKEKKVRIRLPRRRWLDCCSIL